MANQVTGRMVHRKLAMSKKWTALSGPWPRLLYVMLVIFVDNLGRMHADPWIVKSTVFPRDRDVTPEQVGEWLQELHDVGKKVGEEHGLVYLYQSEADTYLYLVGHEDNQTLRQEHSKTSDCPPPPELNEEVQETFTPVKQVPDRPDADTSPERKGNRKEKKENEPGGSGGGSPVNSEARAAVVKVWNDLADRHGFPKVRALNRSTQRYRHLNARLKEEGFLEFVTGGELVASVKRSPFLQGKVKGRDGGDSFRFRFDWLVGSPDNWVKVAEGNYDGPTTPRPGGGSFEDRLGQKEV